MKWALGDEFSVLGEKYTVVAVDHSRAVVIARREGATYDSDWSFEDMEQWALPLKRRETSNSCHCGADITYGIKQAEYLHNPDYCPKYKRPPK